MGGASDSCPARGLRGWGRGVRSVKTLGTPPWDRGRCGTRPGREHGQDESRVEAGRGGLEKGAATTVRDPDRRPPVVRVRPVLLSLGERRYYCPQLFLGEESIRVLFIFHKSVSCEWHRVSSSSIESPFSLFPPRGACSVGQRASAATPAR